MKQATNVETTKSPFKPWEYRVVPISGYRWHAQYREDGGFLFKLLPGTWHQDFMTQEAAEAACRSHAVARRSEYEWLSREPVYLGKL